MKVFQLRYGVLAIMAAGALSACSILEGEKIDYRSAGKGQSLEVPPDLTQLSRDSRYQIPGGTVTASAYGGAQAAPSSASTAASSVGDVRIERAGSERWLVVNRPPEQLWDSVREFWQQNGFTLSTDQPQVGVMETDWAENRAKIPQDFVRNMIGKVIDSLYTTPERDKFRTRMERGPGGTEIYISHRGMQEVYTSAQRDSTVWQPRPADPDIEAEFLRRLMVKLGTPAEQAKSLVATAAPAKATSRVTKIDNAPAVEVDDRFDRAWRRVGLALDRTGFTVEDRDRNNGTYYVRYVEAIDRKSAGFFSRLFGKDEAADPVKYRVTLKPQGDKTIVSVLDSKGAPDTSATAEKIVKLIADDLK